MEIQTEHKSTVATLMKTLNLVENANLEYSAMHEHFHIESKKVPLL